MLNNKIKTCMIIFRLFVKQSEMQNQINSLSAELR